ncbi:50S ribosomal protein L4 [Patescibacteria group bacterium]|nr:50S ribosomal protein L4 [Patescibacteria group bacterium]
MSKVDAYSAKGTKLPAFTLPKGFEEKGSMNLLAQAIRVYEARGHFGLAKAQTRAEVNRTKKKVYKQKGTGGARHGSRSAPIYVGGGKAHGPRPVERALHLPEKMRQKALKIALGLKVADGKVVFVSDLGKIKKTKEAQNLMDKIGAKGRVVFVLKGEVSKKSFINIRGSQVIFYRDLNAYNAYLGGTLIFDKAIFEKEAKK